MKKAFFTTALLAVAASHAAAQTIVTPSNLQGWAPNFISAFGTVAITATQPRGAGTGSLKLTGTGSADRTRYAFGTPRNGVGLGKLNELSTLSFDWFRSSSSTTSAWHVPVFRLTIADPGQQINFFELVWEYEYQFQNSLNSAPTNQWINNQDLLEGNWYRGASVGFGCTTLYFSCLRRSTNWGFSADAYVYGISIGTGGGWADAFNGFADDVRIGFGTAPVTSFDFETQVAVIPEPSTYALLASGLVGLFAVQRRRRRA